MSVSKPLRIAFVLKPTRRVRRAVLPALELWLARSSFERVDLLTSEYRGHALQLAADASAWADSVIAVGGDGTLHEVLNGVREAGCFEADRSGPVLGLLPGGTANDFARSAGLVDEPRAMLAQLQQMFDAGRPGHLDMGSLCWTDAADIEHQRWFINSADVGLGAEVVRGVNRGRRRLGAHLSYLRAILGAFLRYRPASVRIVVDGAEVFQGRLLILVIANGRFLGAGLEALPGAELDDGVFDLLVAGEVPLGTLLYRLPQLRRGERLQHPRLQYHRGSSVVVTLAEGQCSAEADGEFLGSLPLRVALHHARLPFWLPPTNQA